MPKARAKDGRLWPHSLGRRLKSSEVSHFTLRHPSVPTPPPPSLVSSPRLLNHLEFFIIYLLQLDSRHCKGRVKDSSSLAPSELDSELGPVQPPSSGKRMSARSRESSTGSAVSSGGLQGPEVCYLDTRMCLTKLTDLQACALGILSLCSWPS